MTLFGSRHHFLVIAFGLMLAPTPGSAADNAEMIRRVEALEASWHLPAGWLNASEFAFDAARVRPAKLDAWFEWEARRRLFGFARRGASPSPTARYKLPFDPLFPRVLSQGFDGRFADGTTKGGTHIDSERFAVDFIMPMGAEVRAARAGRVGLVIDGFGVGGKEASFAQQANLVAVLHDDHSFASYVHLQSGIPVSMGQRVAAGDLLGTVGLSGFTEEPHLHFSVSTRNDRGFPETIRFRFGAKKGFEPKALQRRYGASPAATVAIEVRVNGEVVGEEPVDLPKGETAEISVRVRSGSRWQVFDPANRSLKIDTLTPSTLRVDGALVRASASPGFEHWDLGGIGGELRVVFQQGRARSWKNVRFTFGGYLPPEEIRR